MNPKMAGTQYDGFLKTPDENEYIPLLARTSCIRRWDISPELPGAHDFAKYTRSKGIMTAVTHTEAEYDEIKAAYAVVAEVSEYPLRRSLGRGITVRCAVMWPSV